jgi:hypothetical protein
MVHVQGVLWWLFSDFVPFLGWTRRVDFMAQEHPQPFITSVLHLSLLFLPPLLSFPF